MHSKFNYFRSFAMALTVLTLFTGKSYGVSERTLTVSGKGTATGKPDQAKIKAAVQTQSTSPKKGIDINNRVMGNVLEALEALGVAQKDIETSTLRVRPYTEKGVPGYQVSNSFTVCLHDLSRIGEILVGVVHAGANSIFGVNFEVADPTDLLDEARRAAVADALHLAKLYASAAHVKLGKIRSLQEGGYNAGSIYAAYDGVPPLAVATEGVIVPPDTVTFDARVSIEFAIK